MNFDMLYHMSYDTAKGVVLVCIALYVLVSVMQLQKRRRQSRCGRKSHLVKAVLGRKGKRSSLKKSFDSEVNGLPFGKDGFRYVYSPAASEGHIAVLGATGTGKSSAVLIPCLKNWTGASLVIDISGDLSSNVDKQDKMEYDPTDPAGIPYNVFALIDGINDEDMRHEELEQLAFLLMPEMRGAGSEAAVYFREEGRKILTGALIAFYDAGMDFIDICKLIVSLSYQELFAAIDKTENEKAIMYINGFEGGNERNISGCKQAVDRELKLFATNERVAQTIRRPRNGEVCFSPDKVVSHNVFVLIPDVRLKLFGPLLRIIVSQCMSYLSERDVRDTRPVLLALDEFASFGHLPGMVEALQKYRKRHVRIMILTQSVVDIDIAYGEDERTSMLNNFMYKIVLGVDDPSTQEYLSKMIGCIDIPCERALTGYVEERAVRPYELSRLGNDLILICPEGDGYMRLRKNYYFKHRQK